MKVCFISDVFPPSQGGIPTYAYEASRHIAGAKGIEKVTVLTFSGKPGIERCGNIEVRRLMGNSKIQKFRALRKAMLELKDYDLFHSFTLFPSGLFGVFNSKRIGKKFFVTLHGLEILAAHRSPYKRFLARWVCNNATGIISVSKSTRQKVSELYGLPESFSEVIYFAIEPPKRRANPERIRKRLGIAKGFVLMSFGRIVERKGIDDMIRAANGLKGVTLVVAGDGPHEANLRHLAKELGAKNVIFTGRVPEDEKYDYYSIADAFAMPSKYLRSKGDIEGLGIVLLEAQAMGIPVIGSDSGGVPEAVGGGFVVKEGDWEGIRKKILLLKSRPSLRKKLGSEGRRFVKDRFNWQSFVSKHLRVYSQ